MTPRGKKNRKKETIAPGSGRNVAHQFHRRFGDSRTNARYAVMESIMSIVRAISSARCFLDSTREDEEGRLDGEKKRERERERENLILGGLQIRRLSEFTSMARRGAQLYSRLCARRALLPAKSTAEHGRATYFFLSPAARQQIAVMPFSRSYAINLHTGRFARSRTPSCAARSPHFNLSKARGWTGR